MLKRAINNFFRPMELSTPGCLRMSGRKTSCRRTPCFEQPCYRWWRPWRLCLGRKGWHHFESSLPSSSSWGWMRFYLPWWTPRWRLRIFQRWGWSPGGSYSFRWSYTWCLPASGKEPCKQQQQHYHSNYSETIRFKNILHNLSNRLQNSDRGIFLT